MCSGPGEGSHHFCGQDRRVPDVPQCRVHDSGDSDSQVERDERVDPQGRGLRRVGYTRAVQDCHTGRQACDQRYGVRLESSIANIFYLT